MNKIVKALNEVKEAMKLEKQLDEKLHSLHELFEDLEKKDYNSGILRGMQVTATIGTRPRLYSLESLMEMLQKSELLSEDENKTLAKIGKNIAEICEEVIEGNYNNLIMTEFSSCPYYTPTKKLFTAFRNNYALQSKLF